MKRRTPQRRWTFGAALLAVAAICASTRPARADDADTGKPKTETVAIHGQATVVDQGTLPFHAPDAGTNSLTPRIGRETFDATLYVGFRPWSGAEVWANPELDQGFGLDNTLGVAGFPSGEAYKVGKSTPYFRLPRLFLRQTIDLGGKKQSVDADLNQLAGSQTANRVVITLGKFGVTDVFDTNAYAHDPRGDFLNWALVDTATFDYAADAWGYTYGAAVEWYQGRWTLRAGAFDLSVIPNNSRLDSTLGQDQYVVEIEERHTIGGQAGRLMLTGYLTRGRMGTFADAIALAATTGQPPSTASVRRYRSRPGVSLDLEQTLADDLGLFVRAGIADGDFESYEFTDVDATFAAGLSLSGKRWGRKDDTLGVAGVINGISKIHQEYFADGGLGILVGDGELPHPGPEEIIETYYKIALTSRLALSLDGQLVTNPGYNRDRGPAPIVAARLHAQF
ncbi:MAG TPA: carbohydrate porin [Caulobacteraceae bacterium]|nr:carbohydrate porin [Caulobacteraceae bacterium]